MFWRMDRGGVEGSPSSTWIHLEASRIIGAHLGSTRVIWFNLGSSGPTLTHLAHLDSPGSPGTPGPHLSLPDSPGPHLSLPDSPSQTIATYRNLGSQRIRIATRSCISKVVE
jgi:hypothetical protein